MATMVHGVTVKVLSGLRGLSNGGLMVSYNSYIMLYMYIYIFSKRVGEYLIPIFLVAW